MLPPPLVTATVLPKLATCSNNVLLVTHERPDGDAVASVCIMIDLFELLGKKYSAFCADQFTSHYQFLSLWNFTSAASVFAWLSRSPLSAVAVSVSLCRRCANHGVSVPAVMVSGALRSEDAAALTRAGELARAFSASPLSPPANLARELAADASDLLVRLRERLDPGAPEAVQDSAA